MPLKVTCRCGETMKIEDADRGTTVKCAQCDNAIAIPPDKFDRSQSKPEKTPTAPQPVPKSGRTCPLCGKAMSESVVHCEYCVGDP